MLVDMGCPSFGWRLPYAHRIRFHRDGHSRRDVVLDPLEQQSGLVAAIRDLRRIWLGDRLCWFFAYRPAHLPTIIGFPGRAASRGRRDRAALEARLKELGSRVLP